MGHSSNYRRTNGISRGIFFIVQKNREKERKHRAELMTRNQKSIEENAPQSQQDEEKPSI